MKKQNKTILVTGGAGFIGSHLVDKLVELNYKVIIINKFSNKKKKHVNPKAILYKINICDKEKVEQVFEKEKPDFVFHLAAQIDVQKAIKNPTQDIAVNILGGLNILENCLKYKVEKIIFTSSAAVYGNYGKVPIEEESLKKPINPYGVNKLSFEKYLDYYHQVFQQKYISLRFSNAYGPRQYKGGECGVIGLFIDSVLNNKDLFINGDGKQTRDFIYVSDLVDALVLAVKSNFVGKLNVSTNKEINLLDLLSVIEKKANKKIKLKFRKEVPGDIKRSCLSNKKAKKELGWKPKVSIEEGVGSVIGG